jgi:light-regulated signal transduction histidine kinase (bacteriophytochrome)
MSEKSKIETLIHSLNIDDKQKRDLLDEVKKTQKQATRLDFQLNRTKNDRDIAVNLLNVSIEDLEKQQTQLSEQKLLLETQSKDLQASLKKLENSYKELEQFSYIASHDLRSPLRSIAGFAQLLQRKYKGEINQEADEYIDFIVKATVHMGNVIRDLLEYSKTGKSDLPFDVTDISNLINDVLGNLQAEIDYSNAVIEIGEMPTLNIYQTGITQLFQNLISNAIKFKQPDVAPFIKISASNKDNIWQFSIADNGIGLDEEFQEKVFLPFQRIYGNKVKGTGIGLAICKKIVLLHRGDIWYNSKPNEGSIFHFTIKVDEE